MKKLNCWEYKKCCQNSGNLNTGSVCPVKEEFIADGLNGGINGGRICWTIMENHCKQKAKKDCFQCEFHYRVMNEEGLLNTCNSIGVYLSRLNNRYSPAIDRIA
ncbi:MAG: hypothetical protein JSU99_08115 [Nitrospiraceae bacterium]|nr:MAG: hypothetical protein JSU99_08115 [Nitrospiraceae bacterium]